MPKRSPGETWNCAACGQYLVGAKTINGKVAPIEVALNAEGTSFLFRRNEEVRVAVLTGEMLEFAKRHEFELRHNHFATCKHAERFRKQRETAEGSVRAEG
jgi:hypothetical protein